MTKLGPYELGLSGAKENGIYCGDCRQLAKAIPDESVDLILTDPPFGINFDYGTDYQDKPDEYLDLIRWIVAESNRIIKPGGLCFVFQAMKRLRETWILFPPDSRLFAACKNFVQIRPTQVQYAFDPVVFWQKTGPLLRKPHGRDWHIGNTANTNNRKLGEAAFHSCPRPLDTICYIIENFCPSKGIVVDFFMGSGTTALAAYLTNRSWWGAEIDSNICVLARKRVHDAQPLFAYQEKQLELME